MPYDAATYNYSSYAAYPYQGASSYSWQPPPPAEKRNDDAPAPPAPPLPPADDEDENWDDLVDGAQKMSSVVSSEEKPEEDEESNLDLDTRIAMMFKGKSLGAAPPFLQLDSDDEENGKDAIETSQVIATTSKDEKTTTTKELEQRNGDKLSAGTPPKSPFMLTDETSKRSLVLKNSNKRKVIKAEGTSDISSSDDELLAKEVYSPIDALGTKMVEEMSLSSLSSTKSIKHEEPITGVAEGKVELQQSSAAINYYPGAPPGYFVHPSSQAYPYNYNYGYNHYQSYISAEYIQQYMAGFSLPSYGHHKPHEDGENPYKKAVSQVLDRMTEEMKQILKKDFNKRMVEGKLIL